jgi:hypothetical protein
MQKQEDLPRLVWDSISLCEKQTKSKRAEEMAPVVEWQVWNPKFNLHFKKTLR